MVLTQISSNQNCTILFLGLIKTTDCTFHLLHLIPLSATSSRNPLNQSSDRPLQTVIIKYFQVNFLFAWQPLVGQGLLNVEASRSHSDTRHSLVLLWRVIRPKQRPLPDNTQHSQQTDICAPGGIRTSSPSKRTAVEVRLIPLGHCD